MINTQYQNNGGFMPNRNQFTPYFNNTPSMGASAPVNNIIQVQGIEGAKAYQLNPSSMVILLDSEEEGKMYIKVSDNIGISNLRIFNYVEEVKSSSANVTEGKDLDLSVFVRKDELSSLIKEIITNEQTVQGTAEPVASPAPAKPKVTFVGNPSKQS